MTKEKHRKSASNAGASPRNSRPVPHSPLFWVGFVLILVAIAFYVLSDDLAWRPHLQ
jgi:hypothetical protein